MQIHEPAHSGVRQPFVNARTYRVVRTVIVLWLTLLLPFAFLREIPRMEILEHTARNLYFHVPMWFAMLTGVIISAYHSARYLGSGSYVRDVRALQAARVAFFFGILGITTGIVWARFTWYVGTNIWWNFDPRQTLVAVHLLIYGAYFVLRSSIDDPVRRARVAAAYNLFAAATMPFLMYVLPRQMDSLHPGAEGTPAFSETDLAPAMRPIFYAAALGFIGLYWLLYTQRVRLALLERRVRHWAGRA